MALLPTIPTSFVPHSNVAPKRFHADFSNAFGLFAYAVLGIVFLLALSVFFYGRILAFNQSSKDAKLKVAVDGIQPTTIDGFIRLRDRLSSGKTLLNEHVAFSGFFSLLEKIIPETVRFTTIHLSFNSTGVPKIDGAGVAKSFNALAAASTAFADDGHIKDAIFSNITINKDSSVSFSLVASIDTNREPKIIFSL